MFDQVLQEVEAQCREERIPMLGTRKGEISRRLRRKGEAVSHR